MKNNFQSLSSSNQAILFMITTLFMFSIMDIIAKHLSSNYDTFQIVWARYASQLILAFIFLAPKLNSLLKTKFIKLQLIRSTFLFAATCFFFNGIYLVGLAKSAAIMAINPLIITIFAVLFLKEKAGIRRVIGVSLGFIGTLIIIRPGTNVFEFSALLPLGAAICYSGYAISTRFLGAEESPWTSFLYTALMGAILASLAIPFYWTTPSNFDLTLMIFMGIAGGIGHYCIIRAFTLSEASAIAPYSYIGIIFATFWGMLLFNEFPDMATYFGALVVVSAGFYVWWRETTHKSQNISTIPMRNRKER